MANSLLCGSPVDCCTLAESSRLAASLDASSRNPLSCVWSAVPAEAGSVAVLDLSAPVVCCASSSWNRLDRSSTWIHCVHSAASVPRR